MNYIYDTEKKRTFRKVEKLFFFFRFDFVLFLDHTLFEVYTSEYEKRKMDIISFID